MLERLTVMGCAALPVILVCGCAQPDVEPRAAYRFVDHEAWVEGGADPWPEHAPDPVDCSSLAWSYGTSGGEPSLEVSTADCNYLLVEQPSTHEALAGDELRMRLWHFDLIQPDPAEAHAGVQVGDQLLFDVTVPIPSAGEMVERAITLQTDLPEGSPVVFHLHNHGENTWNLVELSVNPPETLED